MSRRRGFHFQEVSHDMEADQWPRMIKPAVPGISGNLKIKTTGFFTKWKTYFFVVQNGDLCYYSNAMGSQNSVPVGKFPIRDTQLFVTPADNLTGKDFSFLLYFPLIKSSVYLCAPSEAEMKSWMSMIASQALNKPRDQIQTCGIEGIHNYVEAISDAAVMSDATGIIMAWNRAATNLFGWTAEEAKGQNVNILIPERWRVVHDSCVLRYQYTGEKRLIGVPRKLEAVHKNGSSVSVEISLGEVPGLMSRTDSALDPSAPRWMALFREVSTNRTGTDFSDSASDFNDSKDNDDSEAPQPAKCPFHAKTNSSARNSTSEGLSPTFHVSYHDAKSDLSESPQSQESSSSRSSSSEDTINKSVNEMASNVINTLLANNQELQERVNDLQQTHDFLRYENQRLLQLVVESQQDRQRLERIVKEYKLQIESSHVEIVLHDPNGFESLLEFAQHEHTEENLLFWKAVETYRQTQFASNLPQVARAMYTWYFQPDAPRDLNINNEIRESITSAINASDKTPLTRGLFDSVQRSIFHTIRDDIWPRFLNTDRGKQLNATISS